MKYEDFLNTIKACVERDIQTAMLFNSSCSMSSIFFGEAEEDESTFLNEALQIISFLTIPQSFVEQEELKTFIEVIYAWKEVKE